MLENGYGLCSNNWLFDNTIKNELRLLIYISSLSAEKGYCYAKNEHFSNKFGETTVSISRKVGKLEKKGYIFIEYIRRGAEVINRKIRLTKMLTDDKQKCYSTVNKIVKDNNIINNNTIINNLIPQKKFEGREDFINICNNWLNYIGDNPIIKYNLEKYGKQKMFFKWCDTLDKLERLDKLTIEQIKYILEFIKKDTFWSEQILTINKLREKNKEKIPYFMVMINKIKQTVNTTAKINNESIAVNLNFG